MVKMRHATIIRLNPRVIVFNPKNPHRHAGKTFSMLQQSIAHLSIVQLPSVRILPGGAYECIDGEGRIRAAIDAGIEEIEVVSFGVIDDTTAFLMLQSANAVRSYSLLEEAIGVAELHRRGLSYEAIAQQFDVNIEHVIVLGAVGHFPDDIRAMIMNDIIEYGDAPNHVTWSLRTFRLIATLREQLVDRNGMTIRNKSFDGTYDYTHVRKVVTDIIQNRITSQEQLMLYIESKRREMYEQRFDVDVKKAVEQELAKAKEILERHAEEAIVVAEKNVAESYEKRLQSLQSAKDQLELEQQKSIRDAARKPYSVKKLEEELKTQVDRLADERKQLEQELERARSTYEKNQRLAKIKMEQQLSEAAKRNAELNERENERTRVQLENFYREKDRKRQVQVEATFNAFVAKTNGLLAQTQQALLLLLTPEYKQSFQWISKEETLALLAQFAIVRRSLQLGEQFIKEDVLFTQVVDTEEKKSV